MGCRSDRGLIFDERNNPGYLYMVPLVLLSPSSVHERLRSAEFQYGLEADSLWAGLPWMRTVRGALRHGGDDWVNSALDWIELLRVDVSTVLDDFRVGVERKGAGEHTLARIRALAEA